MKASKRPSRIVIIGAGPSGLGVGWRLAELGYKDFVIYEKETYAGGLATSFVDPNGFTWDIGGHVLHSHYRYFDQMFESVMRNEYFTHERESWVWILNRFVPYPFQNNIHRLPPRVLQECLDGLYKVVRSKRRKDMRSFFDWIMQSFGPGIAKHFLLPYNRKVWAYPPEQMNYRWVGDRVATIHLDRIERNIRKGENDVSWGPNAVFYFPERGGTGEIWRRVSKRFTDKIVFRKEVLTIDARKKRIRFSDGTYDTYDVLFSSIPLDQLTRITTNVQLPRIRHKLHHSSVTIVGIGVKGETPEHLQTKCWMYFPESIAPFFRATVFSNYSAFNAPKGAWSLMTEVSSSSSLPLPKGDIGVLALEGARQTKLIPRGLPIESIWTYHSDYGYPTPTLTRDRYLDVMLPFFVSLDIYPRGRFGAWRYEVSNQDHTFMQGVEWANNRVLGEKEITIHHPTTVNSKKS